MSRPGFQVPKVTVTSARTAAPSTTPVSASTPLGRSTATTVAADCPARPASVAYGSRSPPWPPMPSIPSRIRSAASMGAARSGSWGAGDPAPRAPQGGRAALVDPGPGRHGQHGGAPAGQLGRGVESVTAVVPAAGQHHDPGSVDPAEQLAADGGQASGRPLHQCSVGQGGHQLGLSRPDLGYLTSFAHVVQARASRTTSATWWATRSA